MNTKHTCQRRPYYVYSTSTKTIISNIAFVVIGLGLVGSAENVVFGDEYLYGVGVDRVYVVKLGGESAVTSAELFDTPGYSWYGSTNSDNDYSFWATTCGEDSALYRISPYNQTVTKIGNYGTGLDIKELAYNENTNTLYGTDYANLYTINTGTGAATFVGPHGTASYGTVENLWSMDYDSSINELVAFDQQQGLGEPPPRIASHKHYIDPSTGAASYAGDSHENGVTDVYYSHQSGQMYASGNLSNRFFEVHHYNGGISEISQIGHNILGVGGDFAGSPGVGVALSSTNSAHAEAEVEVELGGSVGSDYQTDSGPLSASVQPSAFADYLNENDDWDERYAKMDAGIEVFGGDSLSSYVSFDTGFMGTGGDCGSAGGWAEVSFDGIITIGTSPEYPDGAGGLMLIVDGMLNLCSDMVEFTLDGQLKIYDNNPDEPLLLLDKDDLPEEGTWGEEEVGFTGALMVNAGDVLNIEFTHTVTIDIAFDEWGELETAFDLNFSTVGIPVPEPATIVLLGIGALALLFTRKK